MMNRLFIFLLLMSGQFSFSEALSGKLINQSHSLFFPKEMANVAEPYEKFPVFWWNFLVFETPSNNVEDLRSQICGALRSIESDFLASTGCRGNLESFRSILKDWAADAPWRQKTPGPQQLVARIQSAQAKASLPGGGELLWLLRTDPLESYLDLKKMSEGSVQAFEKNLKPLEISPGILRWSIPIQMSFAPSQTAQTKKFIDVVDKICEKNSCQGWVPLGPHFSVLENEFQIRKDLEVVNLVGILMLLLFIGFLYFVKRLRLLNIVVPIVIAMIFAVGITILFYGSIHGLTLAFGTGLVGLAIDFGLHSAFWQKSWRPNFFGLLTTLAVFGTAAISEIPILRQMMFFGSVGLACAFLVLFLLFKYKEDYFTVAAFNLSPKTSKWRFSLTMLMCLGVVFGAAVMKPNFDLRLFDYQSPQTFKLRGWLKDAFSGRRPLIEVLTQSPKVLEQEHVRSLFAKEQAIDFESVAKYLPPVETQKINRQSWIDQFCLNSQLALAPDLEDFAKPFLTSIDCSRLSNDRTLENSEVPKYLSHLYRDGQFVHMWFPKSESEVSSIKERFPKSVAIDEVAMIFAKSLSRDIFWIVITSIVGVFLLLWIEFKNLKAVVLSSIPFFSGSGLMFWSFYLLDMPLSFMSLIGLVMICGFSVDYGIFVTDAMVGGRLKNAQGLWSALSMCAVCTIGGFVPMVFGQHPVLKHLGLSLLMGSVGTYFGTIWGVTGFARYVFRMDVKC